MAVDNINGSEVQSLYNFMTTLNGNNVRSNNLFEMRVFIPDDLKYKAGKQGNYLTRFLNPNFTFYGQGFEIPGRNITYQDVGFKGFTVPVPTVIKMDQEHTVKINCDIKGEMRRAFLLWQALTINPQINSDGGYFEGNRLLNGSSMIKIYLLDPTYDKRDKITEVYTIFGVTVEKVGSISVSNTEANIATFDVTFKSQYWQYGDSNDGKGYSTFEALSGAKPEGSFSRMELY